MSSKKPAILIGRIAKDVLLSRTSAGTPYVEFTLAVKRIKEEGDAWVEYDEFFPVACYGEASESLHPNLTEDAFVCVDGSFLAEHVQLIPHPLDFLKKKRRNK